MKTATLLMAIVTFGSFWWAIHGYFYRGSALNRRMRWLESIAGVFLPLHAAALVLSHSVDSSRWAGAFAAYAVAFGLFWWTIATVSRRTLPLAFSAVPPAELVVRGPFRWIRHPFYTSYAIAWLGAVIASLCLWLIPTLVIMGWLYACAALEEERLFADGEFAMPYRDYARSAGMFWPRLGAPLGFRGNALQKTN